MAGIRGLVAKTDQSQASHKLNWTERDFDLSLDVNVKHTERVVRIISKKRIKIQEYIIESAKSYPVIFFRGGSTTDARSEVWPVRPTGQQGLSGHSAHCHSAFRLRYKKGSLVCYTAFLVLHDDSKTCVA